MPARSRQMSRSTGIRWRQRDVFGRVVSLSNYRWRDHILRRHGLEIGEHSLFEQDMRSALARPQLVYLDSGSRAYTDSEMFVECSSDDEYLNYVVLVAVKAPDGSPPFVASGRLRPEVPNPGRRQTNVIHGSAAMHPCGSPRAEMKQRITGRNFEVLTELRAVLEDES